MLFSPGWVNSSFIAECLCILETILWFLQALLNSVWTTPRVEGSEVTEDMALTSWRSGGGLGRLLSNTTLAWLLDSLSMQVLVCLAHSNG